MWPSAATMPAAGQALDRRLRERKLRRQRHQANELRRGRPLRNRAEIDGGQLLDRNGPGRLRVEERPLQVEAQAERVVDLLHGPRGQEIAGDPGRADVHWVVDLQVDEPREDQRLRRSALHAAHLCDRSALDEELAREGALDRVNDKSL